MIYWIQTDYHLPSYKNFHKDPRDFLDVIGEMLSSKPANVILPFPTNKKISFDELLKNYILDFIKVNSTVKQKDDFRKSVFIIKIDEEKCPQYKKIFTTQDEWPWEEYLMRKEKEKKKEVNKKKKKRKLISKNPQK